MPKNRDFLDYLSLGNQLVQTSRLGDVRDAQAALATLEAERLKWDKLKADAQAQENKIREFVFGSSKLLHGLEAKFAQSKPVGTLALLYGLQRHSESLGISTARVRSYEDKEKVHEFLEHVKRVVADCEGRLDAKSIQDSATCAKYRAEECEVAALIEYETKQLELKERQKELTKLGNPGMKHNLPPLLAVLMFGIGFAFLMATGAFRDANQSVDPAFPTAGVVLLLLGGWGLVYKGKNEALLLKEKLDAELQVSEAEAELITEIRKDVGEGDLDHYRNLQAERTAFVEEILGDDDPNPKATPEPE
jgi:hypothetical protein